MNPFEASCLSAKVSEPKKCKSFDDCDDPYNWFCEIPEGEEEGTCEHRCLAGGNGC